MPQILTRLLHTCNDAAAGPKDLARLASRDPSLSAKIIQMASTSAAGRLGKIKSVENAVVYLGKPTVRNIATTASVLQAGGSMNAFALAPLTSFWHHSILCAFISRRIAVEIAYTLPEEAFLTGLMHDIGKLILERDFASGYRGVSPGSGAQSHPGLEAEAAMGTTHGEMGSRYIRQGPNLSIMADAVRYHHDSAERVADAFPLVKIIFAANRLAREQEADLAAGLETAEMLFGFSPTHMRDLVQRAGDDAAGEARDLGILPTAAGPAQEGVPESARSPLDEQARLTSEVYRIALLQGTLQHMLTADSREKILEIAAQGLQAVYDLRKVFFFLHDAGRGRLVGMPPAENPLLKAVSDLEIPLNDQKGLIATSLLQGIPVNSFTPQTKGAASIADEQIIRLLDAQGIQCIPMAAQDTPIGVIAIGVDAAGQAMMESWKRGLTLLAGHMAACLQVENIREEQVKKTHTEFMETSELMARRVTHEVANPLGIIKNYLKILELKFKEKAFDTEELRIIDEEIERVLNIVGQLSGFYRTGDAAQEFIDINFLLSDLIKIMTHSDLQRAGIRVHFNPDISLPMIVSDKNSLKHVFINLMKNAAEAMPRGGNLYLEARLDSTADIINGPYEAEPQGNIKIVITDDGPGIPEHIRARLFEPFNTSKGNGHSGLGLSIAYNMVGNLGGTMTWDSSREKGTRFCITLPLRRGDKNGYSNQ
jgi:signal transduction histidine kinase